MYVSGGRRRSAGGAGVRLIGIDYLSVGGFHGDGAAIHRRLLGAAGSSKYLDLRGVTPGYYEPSACPCVIGRRRRSPRCDVQGMMSRHRRTWLSPERWAARQGSDQAEEALRGGCRAQRGSSSWPEPGSYGPAHSRPELVASTSAALQALADRLDAFSSQGWARSLETLIERRKISLQPRLHGPAWR